jgi:hypothetical protein
VRDALAVDHAQRLKLDLLRAEALEERLPIPA